MGNVNYVERMKNMKEELVDEIVEECFGKGGEYDIPRTELEGMVDIFVKNVLLHIVVPLLTEVGNDD